MTKPLVIIPTYNESENIERLIDTIRQAMAGLTILIVDDNSPDGTGQIADILTAKDPDIHVLHRPGKAGLGRAYQAGFHWALDQTYDPICTMDADFSHNPTYLPKLLELVANGADVAVGSRYVPGGKIVGWTWDRYVISSVAGFLTRTLLGLKPRDVTAGFKCYRRAFVASLDLDNLIAPGYAFQVEMISQAQYNGWKIVETPITFTDRTVGRSKVSKHELITSAKSLVALTKNRRSVQQFIKFGLVGLVNFVIDIGVTNLLVLGFHIPPVHAGIVGVIIALTNSFFLNRAWTFKQERGNRSLLEQGTRFLAVNGLGALLNAGLYVFFITQLGLWYNFAKILAVALTLFWNFFGTKLWVFRATKR